MIAALQKGRQDATASSSGIPGSIAPSRNPGEMDMQKCMVDMSSKLDQILALLKPDAVDATEENPNNGTPDA